MEDTGIEDRRSVTPRSDPHTEARDESDLEHQSMRRAYWHDRAVATEARVTLLREFAEFVVSLDDVEMRRSITLSRLIRKARSALGVVADGGGGRDGE